MGPAFVKLGVHVRVSIFPSLGGLPNFRVDEKFKPDNAGLCNLIRGFSSITDNWTVQ